MIEVKKGNEQVKEIEKLCLELEELRKQDRESISSEFHTPRSDVLRVRDINRIENQILDLLHKLKFDDDEIRYFFDHIDTEKTFQVKHVNIKIQSRVWMYCEPFKRDQQ